MSIFSQRLRQLRKDGGYTLQQFSDRIGIPRTTLANYEHGSREPSLNTVQRLAKELVTTTDYLLGLTDNPSPREINNNAHAFLDGKNKQLHWDGIPLEEEDLEPIRKILERIAMYRLPQQKKEKNNERTP